MLNNYSVTHGWGATPKLKVVVVELASIIARFAFYASPFLSFLLKFGGGGGSCTPVRAEAVDS
jgi:hypothetical protein